VSRPVLGPTQPPVQWVPEVLSPGVKRGRGVTLTTHLIYCRSREWGAIPPLPPSASVACSGTALMFYWFIKYRHHYYIITAVATFWQKLIFLDDIIKMERVSLPYYKFAQRICWCACYWQQEVKHYKSEVTLNGVIVSTFMKNPSVFNYYGGTDTRMWWYHNPIFLYRLMKVG
jgi:hypothetical protein